MFATLTGATAGIAVVVVLLANLLKVLGEDLGVVVVVEVELVVGGAVVVVVVIVDTVVVAGTSPSLSRLIS